MKSKFLRGFLFPIFILAFSAGIAAQPEKAANLVVEAPGIALSGVAFEVKIKITNEENNLIKSFADTLRVTGLKTKTDSGVSEAPTYIFQDGSGVKNNIKY